MIIRPRVPFQRLILSLSEALDCVHPDIAGHQQRVAYVGLNVARELGMSQDEVFDVFRAAALHDVGLVRVEDKIMASHGGELEDVARHPEAGCELLRGNPLLGQAAQTVRFHHTPWADGRGAQCDGQAVPMASHVVFLADCVERAIRREVHVLDQAKGITQRIAAAAGRTFHPDCAEAFRRLAEKEAFWLDCTSQRIYGVLLDQTDFCSLTIDEEAIQSIANVFARVVDAASPWTITHSMGVAAGAVALARRLGFSPRELIRMRAAGLFHDLGKLTVPARILDKADRRLSPQDWSIIRAHSYHTFRFLSAIGGMPQTTEWAAFHHERLDGSGYPFRHQARDLTLGSRVMAVADVFTALAEDRPYRDGMLPTAAVSVLDNEVRGGGLDGDIVSILKRDYDEIDAVRREEQAVCRPQQDRLARILESRRVVAS